MNKYDFSGWATRNNIKCSDGRTILKDAFKDCDGRIVPLVWEHQHNSPYNVLGHALLENREDGVYAYGYFNETESGNAAKMLVKHGDIVALSIYANHLKHSGDKNVEYGLIREVSLVSAGANPGAYIVDVACHDDENGEACEYYSFIGNDVDENEGILEHGTAEPETIEKNEDEKLLTEVEHSEENQNEKTVGEVYDTLTDEQKLAVSVIIDDVLEKNKEDKEMKQSVFAKDVTNEKDEVLTHSEIQAIFSEAKRNGSLKDAVLEHGITNIDYMFPEAKTVNLPPEFIKREDSWVTDVLNSVHHSPFSRIKSIFSNITADDARAKGYVKGNQKVEEVFTALKRTTSPATIYKLQKIDRDDVIDITDFNVASYIKTEMRMLLDEELARAILVGDGRSTSSDDHISENNIRPIWKDDSLYTVAKTVEYTAGMTADQKAKAFIRTSVKSRKEYKGSGRPVLFTTEDNLTDMLLMEDNNGRVIYDTEEKLRNALRVSKIVTSPVMENQTRTVSGATHTLLGIIVNLADYNVGADKGGEVNMFDDFDINFNKYEYLIETRCSGALIRPYSAIVIESVLGE